MRPKMRIDLTGKVFGNLTVIGINKIERGRAYWTCTCACGRTKALRGELLRNGSTLSCGVGPCRTTCPDMMGKRFGILTVIAYAGARRQGNASAATWTCLCDCGTTIVRSGGSLRREGPNTSCGCKNDKRWNVTHGMCGTTLHRRWKAMVQRCHNPMNPGYSYYGARGIRVCKRWRTSFAAFHEDMGTPPTIRHTLDRIDNDGNYEPSNCRWALRGEQMRNTRRTRLLSFNGTTQCLSDWALMLGVRRELLKCRLERGWSIERTLTTPPRKR